MSWFPKKSVVVPVDFSDSSFEALRVAQQLVSESSQLHVIHVTQPLHVAEPGMLWGTITDSARLETAGTALRERIVQENLEGATLYTSLGNPAHEIKDLAKQVEADLIVMPSHGRSGLERLFLGSVTEKVLRLADCPVLVLRSDSKH